LKNVCAVKGPEEIIENAWLKTVETFEKDGKTLNAFLWNEDTLRLVFLHNLGKVAKLDRIVAEAPYHIGHDEYRPDLVVDIMTDDTRTRVAFEFKYFGQTEKWKRDLERLQKYGYVGWHYGYFLAIGEPKQCDEVRRQTIAELPHYKVKVLTHPTSARIPLTPSKFAGEVLRATLGDEVPYVEDEVSAKAVAFYEDYLLYFDLLAADGKLVVWAVLLADKLPSSEKVRKLGFSYAYFDDDLYIHPTEEPTGQILIGEYELPERELPLENEVKMFAERIRADLNRFMEIIEDI
jgi:hypothetical protein